MKHISKFNESWFDKKKEDESSDLIPKGVKSSTVRPSSEESERLQKVLDRTKSKVESKVDNTFLQEISDRLYGPDSDEYINAIKELNLKYKSREGRAGSQFFNTSISDENRRREQEIIKSIE